MLKVTLDLRKVKGYCDVMLTDNQKVIQIAAKTHISPRTVRKWWNGEKISTALDKACREACAKLGFDHEPKEKS